MKALTLIVCLALGCATSTRDKELQAAFATNVAAESAFHEFDVKHQADLGAAAKPKAERDADLAAWREQRDKIDRDIAAVIRAIAAAATVQADPSLTGLGYAALIVARELQALGVIP